MQAFPHHLFMGIGDAHTCSRNGEGGHAYFHKDTATVMRTFFPHRLDSFISNVAVCARMSYDDSDFFRPKRDVANFSEAMANVVNSVDATRALVKLANLADMYIEVQGVRRQVVLQIRKTASIRRHSLYSRYLAVVSVSGYVTI